MGFFTTEHASEDDHQTKRRQRAAIVLVSVIVLTGLVVVYRSKNLEIIGKSSSLDVEEKMIGLDVAADASKMNRCGRRDVAYRRPTGQISTAHAGVSARAVDGNSAQQWGGGSCTHTHHNNNPYWFVDIGKQAKPVCGMKIFNRLDGAQVWLKNYKVFVTNRRPVGNFVARPNEICFSDMTRRIFSQKFITCTKKIRGRYVGVQLTGRMYLMMCEVQVFLTKLPSMVPVAPKCTKAKQLKLKGRPTAQFSQCCGGVPNRAVDMNKAQHWNRATCTHSNIAYKPWWFVDIGPGKSVCSVRLFNRRDCCGQRLQYFKVFVTDKKPIPGRAFTIPHNDVCFFYGAGVFSVKTLKCKKALSGRYVGVQLMRRDYLTLCEVDVFAVPTPPPASMVCIPGGPKKIGNVQSLDNYGRAMVPSPGFLKGLTLNHLGGKLQFNKGKCIGGNFGFSFPPSGLKGYQVYVTDSKKRILFPTRKTIGVQFESRNKCYVFKRGPLAVANRDFLNGKKLVVVFDKPMLVRRGQMLRFYTGHNLMVPKFAKLDHGRSCSSAKFDYKPRKCLPGQFFDAVRTYTCAPCPQNFYCPTGGQPVKCPKGTYQPNRGETKCLKKASVCVRGKNYAFSGYPCIISGDPHQARLFNGARMEFMGPKPNTIKYYYVTSCHGTESRAAMPFNIVGTHSAGRASGLDYFTVELFDKDGSRHLVFLNPGQAGYLLRVAQAVSVKTAIPRQAAMKPLVASRRISAPFGAGSRFRVQIRRTSRQLWFTLFVDGKRVTQIFMQDQWNRRGGRYRGQYAIIHPIKVYPCHACGICGDFKKRGQFLPKCNGGYQAIAPHRYSYSTSGLTWRVGRQYCTRTPSGVVAPNPCKAGSAAAVVASRECAKQEARYAVLCRGKLARICNKLKKTCVTDVCLLGVENAARNANGIYGGALGQLKQEKKKMEKELNQKRLAQSKPSVGLACGTNSFVDFDMASGMINGDGSAQSATQKFIYERELNCGNKAVVGATLTGFDMDVGLGKTATIGVSGKAVTGLSALMTVTTSGSSMVYGASTGYVSSCFPRAQLQVVKLSLGKRAKNKLFYLGGAVSASKVLKIGCTEPLKMFVAIQAMSIRNVKSVTSANGKKGVSLNLLSQVERLGGNKVGSSVATVQVSSRLRKSVKNVAATGVVYCPAQLTPEFVQSGIAQLGSVLTKGNKRMRKGKIHACFNPPLVCDEPQITIGFGGLDLAKGYQVSMKVVSASVEKSGFDVEVKAWGDVEINSLTVAYLAVCEE